jgi:predicted N-acetyltransferase YhbS
MTKCIPLTDCKTAGIETLLDAAFGSERKARTAYILRDGVHYIPQLSFGLIQNGILIGSIQCWPVRLKESAFPLILVGPVAVSPDHQNRGHGHMLMMATLDAAALRGDVPMMMIGDPEYYERFGFFAGAGARWQLPGPWEPERLLVRNITGAALPENGMIAPDASYAL